MKIKSNATGKEYEWTKSTPPTPEDYAKLSEYEASLSDKSSLSDRELPAPTQEVVAGTKEEMAGQRARNTQKRLGLVEPVEPGGTVPILKRMVAGAANTDRDRKAFWTSEYGEGSYQPLGQGRDNALVRIPDGNGGHKWVVDNPSGFDAGDIAAASANAPELVSGMLAAIAATPTPFGGLAKIATVSGAGAVAANMTGAVQDILFRYATEQPIDLKEIAKRRGGSAALEFIMGFALPAVTDKYVAKSMESKAKKRIFKAFVKEGEEAASNLKSKGVRSTTSAELADIVRKEVPSNTSAANAGDEIANLLTLGDNELRQNATRAAGMAGKNIDDRMASQLATATSAKSLTSVEAGEAAIGGAKIQVKRDGEMIDVLYNSAYEDLDAGIKASGAGPEIIALDNTAAFIKKVFANTLKTDKGETAKFYTPLLTTLKQIQETTGTQQRLEAVRTVRSHLLSIGRGGDNAAFPGMVPSQAKQLAAALSDDITAGIAKVSGTAGSKLRAADTAYRNLVQPVEENSFINSVISDGFESPELVIKKLATAGSKDWAALKKVLPINTYANVRRAVVNSLKDSETVEIGGRNFVNWGSFSRKLRNLEPEVKDEMFGSRASWEFLEKSGKEFDYLLANDGLFTQRALPSLDNINKAADIAKRDGYDAANKYIKEAISETSKRREYLASSLSSQIRNGNVAHVAENPSEFFHSVIMSGKYKPAYIYGLIKRLPQQTQDEVGSAAFHTYFERARDVSVSTVSGSKNRYSAEAMMRNIFGSSDKKQTAKLVLGEERYALIEDWTKYQLMLDIKASGKGSSLKRFASLVATLPYPNLFAARATAFALEKASGRSFISIATPDNVELFNQARLLSRAPNKTAATIALIQRAVSTDGFSDYNNMMDELTPDQQSAVAAYLEGGVGN
jgi:hypothetical protein